MVHFAQKTRAKEAKHTPPLKRSRGTQAERDNSVEREWNEERRPSPDVICNLTHVHRLLLLGGPTVTAQPDNGSYPLSVNHLPNIALELSGLLVQDCSAVLHHAHLQPRPALHG